MFERFGYRSRHATKMPYSIPNRSSGQTIRILLGCQTTYAMTQVRMHLAIPIEMYLTLERYKMRWIDYSGCEVGESDEKI